MTGTYQRIIMHSDQLAGSFFSQIKSYQRHYAEGNRQLGTKGSELPRGSGHIPTGITWPSPINDVCESVPRDLSHQWVVLIPTMSAVHVGGM